MTRILFGLSVTVLLVGAGCRWPGSEFKFANRFPAPGGGPAVPMLAESSAPAASDRLAERPPERRALVDAPLFKPQAPPERVTVWARPGSDPADRPVDPRLYRDDSRDTRRLEWEERNVLAAQGRSAESEAGVTFRLE